MKKNSWVKWLVIALIIVFIIFPNIIPMILTYGFFCTMGYIIGKFLKWIVFIIFILIILGIFSNSAFFFRL